MKAQKTRQVAREDWTSVIHIFANINKGKSVRLEYFSQEVGDQHLAEAMPLLGIAVESGETENEVTITLGRDHIEYEHRLAHPKELWSVEDEIIELIDDKDGHTVLSVQK